MAATLRAPPPTCPSFSLPSRAFPHLGPGSIHPDGGFIFVFVCLLIHASSYSGHRRGFRSTTECKSPRRLIHFHPSLVDIQLLSVCPPVSCSQDVSVSLGSTGSGVQWPGQPRPHFYPILHTCQTQWSVWLPAPPAPNPGATQGQEWSSSYSAIPPQMEACRSVPNWVSKDKSGFGHQLVRLKQFRWIRRPICLFY